MNIVTDAGRNSVRMSGKNLAVVMRYARVSPVVITRIDHSIENIRQQYIITFYYDDGSQCVTRWASWRVFLDWLLARRSWRSVHRIRFADIDIFDAANSHPAFDKLRQRGVHLVSPIRQEVEKFQSELTDRI